MVNRQGRTSSIHTYREVHSLNIDRREIEIIFENGATTVSVDERSGRGPVAYVDPSSIEPCQCESEIDEAWSSGFSHGRDEGADRTYEVLEALHRSLDGHWGTVDTCHEVPCADLFAITWELGVWV